MCDLHSEKVPARAWNSSRISSCPIAERHAPRTDTGSRADQSASRGPGSPLCRAVSASLSRLCVHAMNSSLSLTVFSSHRLAVLRPIIATRTRTLGLTCGEVELVPSDPSWPSVFERLATPVREACGPLAVAIEHVGSTAVPELHAKPIIDVAVGLSRFAASE